MGFPRNVSPRKAWKAFKKHLFENHLHSCIMVVNMSKQAQATKSAATSTADSPRKLKELFDKRDRTRPGSKDEKLAAEKILETLFPDTNAG